MKNNSEVKATTNARLDMFSEECQSAFFGHDLKTVAVYEKLMAIQEQMNKLKQFPEKCNSSF